MSRRRKSFTESRRARQAMKSERLERLESRNTITEPLSLLRAITLIDALSSRIIDGFFSVRRVA
jgi:hypothetical protein